MATKKTHSANFDEASLRFSNMQTWENIADKPPAVGWTWGYCSAVTPFGWPIKFLLRLALNNESELKDGAASVIKEA